MVSSSLSNDSKSGSYDSKSGSIRTRQALFGTPGRTDILVLVGALGRSYARELARLTGLPLTTVVRAIDDFERAGVLVGAQLGRVREVRLNPEYVAAKELRELLTALVEREKRYAKMIAEAARRRPRRRGKEV
jgi:DNA-binding transcriptional ArsR family regulator